MLIIFSLIGLHANAGSSGVLPDTSVVLISQKNNMAQISVVNTDEEPLLLHTSIVDIPGIKGVTMTVLPLMTWMEPQKRQIVRFLLDDTDTPLQVQQLKRVLFEGVPAVKVDSAGKIQTVSRNYISVIISPASLEQDLMPWKKLHLRWADNTLTLSNPSPYVVRLLQTVLILPGNASLKILPRTYMLPSESFSIPMPYGIAADLASLRIYPASFNGFDVAPFDLKLDR